MSSSRSFLVLSIASLFFGGAAKAQSWPDLTKPGAAAGGATKDAALVISIERYGNLPHIPGAESNGRAWYLHLTKTMGVPVNRVKWLNNSDAAKENIEAAADNVASWAKAGGTVWLVFIGHGAPSKDGGDGVLVGQDAQQTARMLYARSVAQSDLLRRLGAGKQARTVAVVDACFSGRSQGGGALAPGLMPTLAAKQSDLKARTTVLSAGTSKQFAGPLPNGSRPAFSYLVLGALRGWGDTDANGTVTAEEAVTYAGGVLRTLVKGRTQTPQVHGAKEAPLTRVGRDGEKGPDLAAIGAAATTPKAPGTFGRGLGTVTTLPTVGRLALIAPQTSLDNVDVGLLERLQAAKRADKDPSRTYTEVVAKWDAVAQYGGAGALKPQASRRVREWNALNAAVCARRARLAKVRRKYTSDKAKLAKLLGYDDDVLSKAQKAAYRGEFDRAYASWKAALMEKPDARARCTAATAARGRASYITDPASAPQKATVTPDRIDPAAFKSVLGLSCHDTTGKLEKLLGNPVRERSSSVFDYREYHRKSMALTVGVNRSSGQITIIRVRGTKTLAWLRKRKLVDPKLDALVGRPLDNALKLLGAPARVNGGIHEWTYSGPKGGGKVTLSCYDFWGHECRELSLHWRCASR